MGASLLTAVGLPELIVGDLREYERLAVRLGKNAGELQQLKKKLAVNRLTYPLFDTRRESGKFGKSLPGNVGDLRGSGKAAVDCGERGVGCVTLECRCALADGGSFASRTPPIANPTKILQKLIPYQSNLI